MEDPTLNIQIWGTRSGGRIMGSQHCLGGTVDFETLGNIFKEATYGVTLDTAFPTLVLEGGTEGPWSEEMCTALEMDGRSLLISFGG